MLVKIFKETHVLLNNDVGDYACLPTHRSDSSRGLFLNTQQVDEAFFAVLRVFFKFLLFFLFLGNIKILLLRITCQVS